MTVEDKAVNSHQPFTWLSLFFTNFRGVFLKHCFVVLFLLFAGLLKAQSPRISNFNIELVDGNKVLVRWVMNAGSTCRTLEVERSEDRKNFKSVYAYPGICGGENEEEAYTWLDDQAALNRTLYYRVRLAEGEYSLLDSLFIPTSNTDKLFTVAPNPSDGIFDIEFKEQNIEGYTWQLYSSNGLLMQQHQNKSEPAFQVNLSNFNSGVYILKIRLQNGVETKTNLSLVK